MTDEQLERLFTKLGEMHSDIQTLEEQYQQARDERVTLRGDLTTLQKTVSHGIGWGAGIGGTLTTGLALWAVLS